MSEAECRAADWRTVGFGDGAVGAGPDRISRYRSDCAAHGVAPDLDAYRSGREAGLREFCRPRKAYDLARSGKPYRPICPSELEPEFRASYEAGQRVYRAELQVKQAQKTLREHRSRMDRLAQAKAADEAALVSPGLSEAQRRELLDRVMSSQRQLETAASRTIALQDALANREAQLRDLQADAERE